MEEENKVVNPLGVKSMGKLDMVGIPAAIANAVFHATGKRTRNLSITPDKLTVVSFTAEILNLRSAYS